MTDIKSALRAATIDYVRLIMLSDQLRAHADEIASTDRQDIADYLRLASRIAEKFADLRFRIATIVTNAVNGPDDWDGVAITHYLQQALADTEGE